MKACVRLFDIISRASPVEIKRVASLPTFIDPNLWSRFNIFAALRVISDKASSLSKPNEEKLPA